MPKDKAEVQDQYKIGGGSLNEFEFDRSKGAMEEQAHQTPDGAPVEGLRGAAEPNAPQNVAERIRQVEEHAHEIVERRRAEQGGDARKAGGKTAVKSAKAAKKSAKGSKSADAKGGAKGASKKSGASKKAIAKKVGSKKSGAKKGSAKKSAAKNGAAGKGRGSRK
ncbi:MAG: hypothetical protein QOE46_3222 [Acidobacteriota bacterium]|jgi:hypothetical protein|nr:hypothetical protein [Acidobacteriota bacterium]